MKKNLCKAWRNYRSALIGGTLLALILLCAVFAPLIATHDPGEYNMRAALQEPSLEHLCGTDAFGRDIFSRIIYGARVSMGISMSVLVLCGVFGTVLGLLAGYYKRVDGTIMRLMDGLMAFPSVLLALVILSALGAGAQNVVLALFVSYLPRVARNIRSVVLSVKEFEHVQAAKAMGATDARIIFKYILPLCYSPLIIRLSLTMALVILSEASLTFLGVGLSPEIPSWGNLLSEARQFITTSPYYIFYPGLAIVLAVLAFNMLGDGLRDMLDPKLRS